MKEVVMERARESSLLKILCYILIPILVAILGLSILHMAFLNEFEITEGQTQYSETENFANNYLYFFINKIQQCQNVEQLDDDEVEQYSNFLKLEDSQGNTFYFSNNQKNYNYYNGIGAYINYIMIDRETGKMFTNIKSNDYQEVKDNMKHQEIYWNCVNHKIETNLTYINEDNIKYQTDHNN